MSLGYVLDDKNLLPHHPMDSPLHGYRTMADLLVKLYELPSVSLVLEQLKDKGVTVRRAGTWEKKQVVCWVEQTFGKFWASECDVSFSRQPVSCYLATKDGKLIGFGCYDTSMKSFFGPLGVAQDFRANSIGKGLLLQCLHTMAAIGYGYAIIGDASPPEFYEKTVKAYPIPDSSPGIYADRLKDF